MSENVLPQLNGHLNSHTFQEQFSSRLTRHKLLSSRKAFVCTLDRFLPLSHLDTTSIMSQKLSIIEVLTSIAIIIRILSLYHYHSRFQL